MIQLVHIRKEYLEYIKQEAMENFVFPDEIKRKLMKMSKLMNIFLRPIKLCEIAANCISFY